MSDPERDTRIGNVCHFEHVNLRVPDHRLATLFFIEGLGFTRDPTRMVGVRNMWVNVGQQQFHLPLGEARPFAGEVGLTVPDLASARRNLKRVAAQFTGSPFEVRAEGGTLRVCSPWGHRFRLHPAGVLSGRLPQAIPYVRFWVPVGSAAGIARFYAEIVGAPVAVDDRGRLATVAVNVGVDQRLLFSERRGLELPEHRNHVALYLSRYQEVCRALHQRGLLSEPDRREQFRFEQIVDPDGGEFLYRIEHEMRSLYHPDFRKPLVNRVPVPYPVD